MEQMKEKPVMVRQDVSHGDSISALFIYIYSHRGTYDTVACSRRHDGCCGGAATLSDGSF